MKALGIPFRWVYSSLISDKKWLSDRPKCRATLFKPGATQAKTVRKTTVLEWCENMKRLSLSVCHLAVSQSWASYHTSSERGESEPSAGENFLNFFLQIAIFKHIFESRRAWPKLPYILVCHSVTSCRISGNYTPIGRGYTGLSYNCNSLNLYSEIRELCNT